MSTTNNPAIGDEIGELLSLGSDLKANAEFILGFYDEARAEFVIGQDTVPGEFFFAGAVIAGVNAMMDIIQQRRLMAMHEVRCKLLDRPTPLSDATLENAVMIAPEVQGWTLMVTRLRFLIDIYAAAQQALKLKTGLALLSGGVTGDGIP